MATDILLEAGTNEMEMLVFKLGKTPFGINVAKVREIVQRPETISVPQKPDVVEGIFKLREEVQTLVNLGRYFNMEGEEIRKGEGSIIIVELNKVRCGILVDEVEMIHRLSWKEINPPSPYLIKTGAPITGTVMLDDTTVLIVDFETLLGEILGIHSASVPKDIELAKTERKNIKILLADDSSVIRTSLVRILNQGGYDNLTICNDGQQAWDTIKERIDRDEQQYDIVLSDIEMPRMDGLHLTLKIKEDPSLRNVPVILFSSLITEDNYNKGQAVGADAQISKPESGALITAIEDCLKKKKETTSVAD